MKAKFWLKKEAARYVPVLERVEERLLELARCTEGLTGEVVSYLFESRGKLLRPMLTILAASLRAPDPLVAVDAAVASELIHLASLVHDDIIDGACARRGRATVNQAWGNQVAVLTGDYLFATALGLLTKFGQEVVEVMCTAVQLMCRGEINQHLLAYSLAQTEEEYFKQIQEKTSSLFAASCRAGAIVGGCPPEEVEALTNYGLNLGTAFQIMDDVLDFVGDPAVTGKPVGSDFANGVLTLPVLYLLKEGTHAFWVKEVFQARAFTPQNLAFLRELVCEAGGIDYACHCARQYQEAAKKWLAPLPDLPEKEMLLLVADYAVEREF